MDKFDLLNSKMKNCSLCPLSRSRTQVVPGIVSGEGDICFIGEAPGREEDLRGEPFVGRSGKLLDKMLSEIGLERSQVSILNIVKCRPPENRDPTMDEIAVCSSYWLNPQLDGLHPKIVVTLGRVALNFFLPHARITKVAGIVQDYKEFPILPLFHPAYILRNMNLIETYREYFGVLNQYLTSPPKGKGQLNLDDFF